MSKAVCYKHEDRQWDARFNVQTDEYLDQIIHSIKQENEKGKFKYILIGGPEVGTRSHQDDYGIRHIHIAAIFHNRCSKAALLKNWGIQEGNGYYLVPRNRDLPYAGWRDHHTKEFSKIDKNALVIFEAGELPKDQGEKRKFGPSELEKKETTDQVLRNIRQLLENGEDGAAFERYPRNFVLYGERIKSMIEQKKPTGTKKHPHIWLHGFPGTGKTALMNFLYPQTYKKDLNNRFFDLYDPKRHTHIMLEDLDHANVDKLGIQFLKTICDESGFPIDQKYKACQLAKTTVLITSNFQINDVVPEGKGVDETKMALHRRFLQIRIDVLLNFLGLRLIPPYERKQLKKNGNDDPKAILMTYDYLRDTPTGHPVQDPEHYQNMILNAYYA